MEDWAPPHTHTPMKGSVSPMLNPPLPPLQSRAWWEGGGGGGEREEPPSQRATPAERLRRGLRSRGQQHQPVASDTGHSSLPSVAPAPPAPGRIRGCPPSPSDSEPGQPPGQAATRGRDGRAPSPAALPGLRGAFPGEMPASPGRLRAPAPAGTQTRKDGRAEAKRPLAPSRRSPPCGTRRRPRSGGLRSGCPRKAGRAGRGPAFVGSGPAAPRPPRAYRRELGFPGSPTRRIARSPARPAPPGAAKPRPLPGSFHPSGEPRGGPCPPSPAGSRLRGIGPGGGFPGTDAEQRRRKTQESRLGRLNPPLP